MRQKAQAARIIVNYPHIQPRRGLLAQNLVNLPPHLAHADDKALDIDAVLGAAQGGQHISKHTLAVGVILHRRTAADRRGRVVMQIFCRHGGAGVRLFQLFLGSRVGAAGRIHRLPGALQPAAQPEDRPLVAPQKVQKPALHRHKHKQNHPADLELRHGGVLPYQRQTHNHAECQPCPADPLSIFAEPVKHRKQPERLQQHKHHRDDQAAEHQIQHPPQHPPPVVFFHTLVSLSVKIKKGRTHPRQGAVCGHASRSLQAVDGGHAVGHRHKGHGAVRADEPALVPIADDFTDEFAVVLSLDINPVGHFCFPPRYSSVGRAAAGYMVLSAPRLYLNYATKTSRMQGAFCCSLCTIRPIFWHNAQRAHNKALCAPPHAAHLTHSAEFLRNLQKNVAGFLESCII